MRARRFLAAAAVAVTGGSVLGLWTGTGSAVDLAAGGYVVQMYFNGATTAGTTVNLTGTVASGDVFVLAQASAAAPVLAQADQTSTADNTLRRMPAVTAGDTNPADPFDPAAEWTGFPVDTFDGLGTHSTGGPIDQPAVLTCGGTLSTPRGT